MKYLLKDLGLVSGNELRQLEDRLSVFVWEIPEEKEKRIETDGTGCYYAIEKKKIKKRKIEREGGLTADEKLRRSHAALQQENGRQSHRAGSGCSGLLQQRSSHGLAHHASKLSEVSHLCFASEDLSRVGERRYFSLVSLFSSNKIQW